ncbi:hypothetical protein PanWU01x14_195350 [Parasponia andersonii]|uniref:Uncharacterized protein n=1 Tax=Parasponia andersonii TaxID=3476 RepID=A0A2P5C0B7_PARAD|nr:hypothetical protein PanWU01x14_195350 [Parasponia andersonii]
MNPTGPVRSQTVARIIAGDQKCLRLLELLASVWRLRELGSRLLVVRQSFAGGPGGRWVSWDFAPSVASSREK